MLKKPSLSWLGVAAVIAGCAAAAFVEVERPALAQVTHVETTPCRGAASGQVATSSRGQAQSWGAAALNTLCNGVENSTAPGECFTFTMTSNSVAWARGQTTWQPNNALRLCAGALDAGRRLNCFTGRVGGGTAWGPAIDQCIAEERTMNVQVQPSANAPRMNAPLPQGPQTEEQIRAARAAAMNTSANMICRGPMIVSAEAVTANDVTDGMNIEMIFQPAASRTDIRPGQCWREGGWGNGALMGETGGAMGYRLAAGPCAPFITLRMRNGAVDSMRSIDSVVTSLFTLGRSDGGEVTLGTLYAGVDDNARNITRYNAQRAANSPPPQCR